MYYGPRYDQKWLIYVYIYTLESACALRAHLILFQGAVIPASIQIQQKSSYIKCHKNHFAAAFSRPHQRCKLGHVLSTRTCTARCTRPKQVWRIRMCGVSAHFKQDARGQSKMHAQKSKNRPTEESQSIILECTKGLQSSILALVSLHTTVYFDKSTQTSRKKARGAHFALVRTPPGVPKVSISPRTSSKM